MKKKNNTNINTNPTGLSTKNYKPSGNKTKKPEEEYAFKDKRVPLKKSTVIAIIVTCALLIAAIAVGAVFIVLDYLEKNERVDYLHDDLSQYVTVDKSVYDGFSVTVDIPEVKEIEVENAILQLLREKKGDILYDGKYNSDAPLAAGDKAYIWYRGYMIDENGKKTEPSGTCNFYGSSSKDLELGAGSFVTGFELGLIGKKMSDSSNFTKRTTGEILNGDIVYITATCSQESGDFFYDANIRIDLADPDIENTWGIGIRDYLKSIEIGNSSTEVKELITPDGDAVIFTDITVQFTTTHEAESDPIVVTTYFPHNYQAEGFRNQTVYFEVFIEKTLHYESAVYGDDFVKSIGFNEEKLADFDGATLADKYRAYVRSGLENKRQAEIDEAVITSVQTNIYEKAEFHKLPQGDIQDAYDFMYYQLEMEYISELESMGTIFDEASENLDEYLRSRFGLSEDESWQDYLYDVVETDVKERLAYMQVLKQEGLMPTEEEYEAAYRETVIADYEAKYKKTREDFGSDELYEEALVFFENQMKSGYGQTYFEDMLYYNLSINDIAAMVTVKNLATNK